MSKYLHSFSPAPTGINILVRDVFATIIDQVLADGKYISKKQAQIDGGVKTTGQRVYARLKSCTSPSLYGKCAASILMDHIKLRTNGNIFTSEANRIIEPLLVEYRSGNDPVVDMGSMPLPAMLTVYCQWIDQREHYITELETLYNSASVDHTIIAPRIKNLNPGPVPTVTTSTVPSYIPGTTCATVTSPGSNFVNVDEEPEEQPKEGSKRIRMFVKCLDITTHQGDGVHYTVEDKQHRLGWFVVDANHAIWKDGLIIKGDCVVLLAHIREPNELHSDYKLTNVRLIQNKSRPLVFTDRVNEYMDKTFKDAPEIVNKLKSSDITVTVSHRHDNTYDTHIDQWFDN